MTPVVAVWQTEGAWRRLSDYLALTKPRVVAMVLVTTAVGFHLGSGGSRLFLPLLYTLAGTALAAGLVVLQVTLGALTIWSRRAVLPTTTHLVVGAALLATCLVLTLRATRVTLIQPRTLEPVGMRRGALA